MSIVDNSKDILIVDDDLFILEVIEIALKEFNYTVDAVSSAEEAIEKIKCIKYGMVVSDIKMPGINGIDLVKYLKRVKYIGGIVLMTGYAGSYPDIDPDVLGIDYYIKKPFAIEYLLGVIKEILGK